MISESRFPSRYQIRADWGVGIHSDADRSPLQLTAYILSGPTIILSNTNFMILLDKHLSLETSLQLVLKFQDRNLSRKASERRQCGLNDRAGRIRGPRSRKRAGRLERRSVGWKQMPKRRQVAALHKAALQSRTPKARWSSETRVWSANGQWFFNLV